MRHIAAALLLAVPFTALAEGDATSSPAAGAAPEPSWSIGAGVGFGTVFGQSFFIGTTATGLNAFGSVNTSLERKVGARTWLELGVAGMFADDRNAWENVTLTNVPAEDRTVVVQASAGLRRFVTGPGAAVGVSFDVAAEGGAVDNRLEQVVPDGAGGTLTVVQDQTGWLAGGSLGFAVERVLVERLSLRVASPLVGVRYAKTSTDGSGGQHIDSSGWAASLLLAPRLELRLAF